MTRAVWQNLLHNAVKYTRIREEAIIAVGYERLEHEWLFLVRDNGVGVEQADVDKLIGVSTCFVAGNGKTGHGAILP
jgi:light-regulated signal transduction histidine kinase (bacteriophytochrome)